MARHTHKMTTREACGLEPSYYQQELARLTAHMRMPDRAEDPAAFERWHEANKAELVQHMIAARAFSDAKKAESKELRREQAKNRRGRQREIDKDREDLYNKPDD